jgi:hypothetical protein
MITVGQLRSPGLQGKLITGSDYYPFLTQVSRPLPFVMEPRMEDFQSFSPATEYSSSSYTFNYSYSADLIMDSQLVVDLGATPNTDEFKVLGSTIAATAAVDGTRYKIITAGTTDFTLNGAASSTAGTFFTANSTAPIGTGTIAEVTAVSAITQAEDMGHAMIDTFDFSIGGVSWNNQDYHGDISHIQESLMARTDRHVIKLRGRTNDAEGYDADLKVYPFTKQRFHVRLPVYYNAQYGHKGDVTRAFPMLCVPLTQPKFVLRFKPKSSLFAVAAGQSVTMSSICPLNGLHVLQEYVFLDDATRQTVNSSTHYYLIEQHQVKKFDVAEGQTDVEIKLEFNHVCSSFIWWFKTNDDSMANQWLNTAYPTQHYNFHGGEQNLTAAGYGVEDGDAFATASIKINNQDRVQAQSAAYFRLVHLHRHAERVPKEFIYMYSWALDPLSEVHKPAGGINMSRIDRLNLHLTRTARTSTAVVSATDGTGKEAPKGSFYVLGTNYNLVKFCSGSGSISFAS